MGSITSGNLVARMLRAEGVDTIFGIIDGSYFGLYSSFPEIGIRLVTPRHEASALHMAGTYARSTGRLGVAMASNGPGVANCLPGVPVQEAEGHRVLLITSTRRTGMSYPARHGGFQYFDQVGAISRMAKYSQHVSSAGRLPEIMHQALRACFEGRPGLVHVDIPEDILNSESPLGPSAATAPDTYRLLDRVAPNPDQAREVAQLLLAAKAPLIHAGLGVIDAGASDELAQVAELLGAPVVTSWAGRGVLPESNPLMVAMPYVAATEKLRNSADWVMVLGSRVGETDWWGKAPHWARPGEMRTIQVDIDQQAFGGTRPIDVAVLADLKPFLAALAEELRSQGSITKQPDTWTALMREADAKLAKKAGHEVEHGVNSGRIATVAQEIAPDDTLWVLDGGNTVIWGHFYLRARTINSIFTTYKFGMLGAGLGQALGVQVANPGRRVIALIGDGAMGMHVAEIESAVRNHLPVIFIVFADQQWGMVKMSQEIAMKPYKTVAKKVLKNEGLRPDETINTDLGPIRWDEVGRAMGAHGAHVTADDQLAPAITAALAVGGPAVIHVEVDPLNHLWAPELATFKDMHLEPKG